MVKPLTSVPDSELKKFVQMFLGDEIDQSLLRKLKAYACLEHPEFSRLRPGFFEILVMNEASSRWIATIPD